MPRLQKLIAAAGLASRRKAEDLIRAGRVSIDGEVVTTLGLEVDPARADIRVDGRPLPQCRLTYLLLNKPAGVLSTCADTHGRTTVLDAIGEKARGLYPVGRLDADTEGLLLLTDDGDLTLRLTHPRYEVPKVYIADLEGAITNDALTALTKGVRLEDGLATADRARLMSQKADSSRIEIELHTGKKRQIRRMLAAVGFPVRRLVRTRMGPLSLGRLPRGEWRELTAAEVQMLRQAAGLLPQRKKRV